MITAVVKSTTNEKTGAIKLVATEIPKIASTAGRSKINNTMTTYGNSLLINSFASLGSCTGAFLRRYSSHNPSNEFINHRNISFLVEFLYDFLETESPLKPPTLPV